MTDCRVKRGRWASGAHVKNRIPPPAPSHKRRRPGRKNVLPGRQAALSQIHPPLSPERMTHATPVRS